MLPHASVRKTTQELTHWNGHASTYADIYIAKDKHDATSQAVIAAVQKHKQVAAGMAVTERSRYINS